MAKKRKAPEPLDQTDSELELVRSQFEEFCDATIQMRANSEKCRDYRDGKQWTQEEQDTLRKRKQPCITDNKIQDKCDTLLGIEKQMRADPKAFPRTPGDEGAAEAATDALRYVADTSDFNRCVRKDAADNLMVEGLCYGQVIVDPKDSEYAKVCIEHIRWDRGYYDIHSLRPDFEDKRYAGFFTWMDLERAKEEFSDPEAVAALEASETSESVQGPDATHDDKPRYFLRSKGRKRVQVFEHEHIKGGLWHKSKWCRGGWLESPKPSPYKDQFGKPQCCIEIQALYRDRDGNPYGLVQRYLDLQDEHNKRRSKMLHLLNAKRIIAQRGIFEDAERPGDGVARARAELHKPDGVIEIAGNIDQVRIEDNLKEAEGQWQLLQHTDLSLSQTGPNAALLGQSPASASGRAKQIDQQGGTLLVTPLFDALDSWELRMFRQAWNRIKQFWNQEMWIRVTDDEQKMKFVALNQTVTQGDQLAQSLKQQAIPPEQKAAILQEVAADPGAQQPMLQANGQPMKKNDVAQMDIDIIIDRAPDVVNIQQEQFEGLLEIAKVRPEVPFEVLIEASQLRTETKQRVLDRLKGTNDPAAAQQAQFQQMMQQMQAMLAEANIRKTNAQAAKDEAAAAESGIDASVKIAEFTDPSAQPAAKTQVSVN